MTTPSEVELAIKQLSKDDVYKLAHWLQDYVNERWDQEMMDDLESGKLDCFIAQAELDITANNCKNLDEVLRSS